MRILPPLIATLLTAAAPAVAAPWSPQAAFPPSLGNTPVLAVGGNGPQAVYWNNYAGGVIPGIPSPGGQISTSVSVLGAGLVPAAPQTVTPAFAIASYGIAGDAGFGGSGVVLPDAATSVATGPLAGPLAVHKLGVPIRATATNAAGDVAVVTEPCATKVSGCHPAAPSLVLERRGHSFGHPIVLGSKGHAYGAAVAIDPRGRVLVVWDRNNSVYARIVSTSGKLSATQRVGADVGLSHFQAVLPGDGRAAVAWTTQNIDEGDATSPFTVQIALAGSSGRFGRAKLLETVQVTGSGRYIPYQGLVVTLPAHQTGLATWTGYVGGRYVVCAAPITGIAVGAAAVVSDPTVDSVLADAAEGSRGEAVILVLPGRAGDDPPSPGAPGGIDAVTRPAPGQPFGALEQVETGPHFIDGAAVGIDAATGAALATWRDVDGPVGWSVRSPIG